MEQGTLFKPVEPAANRMFRIGLITAVYVAKESISIGNEEAYTLSEFWQSALLQRGQTYYMWHGDGRNDLVNVDSRTDEFTIFCLHLRILTC